MTEALELIGGPFDGMLFQPIDGWMPEPWVKVLFVWRGRPKEKEGESPKPPKGFRGRTTTEGVVHFMASPTFDRSAPLPYGTDVYLKCLDGKWRIPGLAAPPNVTGG